MGDDGGIACHLDFGFTDTKNAHVVSITHLRFDRKHPLTSPNYSRRSVKKMVSLD